MKNVVALRIGRPDRYVVPLRRVAEMGVEGVEITWPEDASVEDVRRMVEEQGMRVTSISVSSKLGDDRFLAPYEEAARRAQALGARVLFTSLRAGDLPFDSVCERLRKLGERAAKHGVRVALETHPDLCANGESAVRTMAGVDHANIGVNFDTANIYYYNEGASAAEELRKVLPHVVSVHLKDTTGGFKSGDFPVFGQGVVDFAAVFELLNGRGFHGPFTMELEGKATTSDTEEGQVRVVAACVAHLRRIGAI